MTTLPLLADFVREVGGDRVQVTSLIPSGVNPHVRSHRCRDRRRGRHRLNGLGFEPAAIQLVKENLRQRIRLVEIATLGEKLEHVGGAEIFHTTLTGFDQPVLWLSPHNGKSYATLVRVELSGIDPDGARYYTRNAEDYHGVPTKPSATPSRSSIPCPPKNKAS